jgi:hypothetical protein
MCCHVSSIPCRESREQDLRRVLVRPIADSPALLNGKSHILHGSRIFGHELDEASGR